MKNADIKKGGRFDLDSTFQGRGLAQTRLPQPATASRKNVGIQGNGGQVDILEFFINKMKIYMILLLDDFSRFILGWKLLEQTSVDAQKKASILPKPVSANS